MPVFSDSHLTIKKWRFREEKETRERASTVLNLKNLNFTGRLRYIRSVMCVIRANERSWSHHLLYQSERNDVNDGDSQVTSITGAPVSGETTLGTSIRPVLVQFPGGQQCRMIYPETHCGSSGSINAVHTQMLYSTNYYTRQSR